MSVERIRHSFVIFFLSQNLITILPRASLNHGACVRLLKMISTTYIPNTLKSRVFFAGGWTFGGHVIVQILRLSGSLVMTRLLVPEMFGVMAIAYVFMSGLALFSDMGISQNIVQSLRGDDPVFLRTAWSVQIVRGILICGVALLLSLGLHFSAALHWVVPGTVYADPLLPQALAVLSLTALISGFDSNRLALARRNLNLAQITKIDIACPIVSLVCMMLWASVDRSIWALVAGGLAGSLTRTLLSHCILPGTRDRWGWDAQAFAEIYSFGKWIFLSSILGFLLMNGDRLLLGGLVGADTLGLYSVAFVIISALQQALSKILSGVAFPAISEVVRNEPSRLKEIYYRFRLPVDAVLLFAAGSLFVLGTPLVAMLYDQRYLGAGAMLEIISLALIAARYDLSEQCYLALGQPRYLTLQNGVRVTSLYLLLPIGFLLFGLPGALWGIVLSMVLVVPFALAIKSKLGLLDIKKELLILPVFLVGFVAGKLTIYFAMDRWTY